MDPSELHRRIHEFPQWHYQLELQGEVTPIFDPRHVNRHAQRKLYFFDPLLELLGGTLEGKRVLDLGCNAGYWSLLALQHGCELLVGIDGRQMHIDQARLVLEVNQIDPERYRLICDNLFEVDFDKLGSFDVVLCLGLLYHVSKPVTLLEMIDPISRDLLIIDTTLSGLPGSLLHLKRENLEDPRAGIGYDLVTYPSRQAVIDMARRFGYSVVVPKPRFSDWEGAADYRFHKRRAFFCSKETSLSDLPVEGETSGAGTQLLDTLLLAAYLFRKQFTDDLD